MAAEARFITITIQSGANVSSAFDLPFGFGVGGVKNDAGWDAADMQLQISRDGTNFLPFFDSAGSLSANTIKILNPAVSTFHTFALASVAGGPLLFMPLGGQRCRIHSVTTTLLTDVNQTAIRTLQVLIFTLT